MDAVNRMRDMSRVMVSRGELAMVNSSLDIVNSFNTILWDRILKTLEFVYLEANIVSPSCHCPLSLFS